MTKETMKNTEKALLKTIKNMRHPILRDNCNHLCINLP